MNTLETGNKRITLQEFETFDSSTTSEIAKKTEEAKRVLEHRQLLLLEKSANNLWQSHNSTTSTTSESIFDITERLRKIEDSLDIQKQKELLKENIDKLAEIGQLKDNWNNYGAQRFSQDLIFKCLHLINSYNLDFQPEIYPTARQSIQMEYEPDENHYLEIEVFEDKIIVFEKEHNDEKHIEFANLNEVIELINEFRSRF